MEATRELAKSLWREGKFDEASAVLAPVVNLPEVPRALAVATSCVLSVVEQCAGRPRRAIEVLRASERLVKAIPDKVLLGQWLNTMGVNLRLVRDYDGAYGHLSAAARAHTEGRAFEYAAQSRGNIGNLFIDTSQPGLALAYLDAAIRSCATPEVVAQFMESKARALLMEGRLDAAEACVLESLRLLEGLDRPALTAESLKTLGAVRWAQMTGQGASRKS